MVGFSFFHLLRVFPLTDWRSCRTGFSKIPPNLGYFLSSPQFLKFNKKASCYTHLSSCFHFLSPSQNIFFLSSLAMYLKICILIFLSRILVVSMERIIQGVYHCQKRKFLYFLKSSSTTLLPSHCPHYRTVPSSLPSKLPKRGEKKSQERADGYRESKKASGFEISVKPKYQWVEVLEPVSWGLGRNRELWWESRMFE